jgi:hypothetical protein
MQVHVEPNASVAGYPVLLVGQALRKLRHATHLLFDLDGRLPALLKTQFA